MFAERHDAVVFDVRLPVCDDVISRFLDVDDASPDRVSGGGGSDVGQRRPRGLDHDIVRRRRVVVSGRPHDDGTGRRAVQLVCVDGRRGDRFGRPVVLDVGGQIGGGRRARRPVHGRRGVPAPQEPVGDRRRLRARPRRDDRAGVPPASRQRRLRPDGRLDRPAGVRRRRRRGRGRLLVDVPALLGDAARRR